LNVFFLALCEPSNSLYTASVCLLFLVDDAKIVQIQRKKQEKKAKKQKKLRPAAITTVGRMIAENILYA